MLTQLSIVKARLQITEATYDDILTNAIAAYSGRFDRECNRKFARQENDTYEFHADARQILLPRFPVESIASFETKSNETEGWVSATLSNYLMFKAGGLLTIEDYLGPYCRSARVTYTGGYVLPGTTPSAGQTPLPADIEQACIDQVAYWFSNRTTPGLMSVTLTNGAHIQTVDLLPSVVATLQKHQRLTL